MKRFILLVAIATLAVAGASMSAQSKPTFAGKWTMVPDSVAAAGATGRGSGLGQEFTAVQDDKTLTVTTNNPQLGELKTVYNLDGSESKNPLNFGGQTVDRVSKVKWDGAKLVITTTISFNGNPAESTQIWMLDGSGNLVVEASSNFTGTPTTSKITYKKN
jgi:uncharacterized membrane protein